MKTKKNKNDLIKRLSIKRLTLKYWSIHRNIKLYLRFFDFFFVWASVNAKDFIVVHVSFTGRHGSYHRLLLYIHSTQSQALLASVTHNIIYTINYSTIWPLSYPIRGFCNSISIFWLIDNKQNFFFILIPKLFLHEIWMISPKKRSFLENVNWR